MADKDAAKRRRQARNRQERISRQKRIEGARRSESARPARTAAATPAAKGAGSKGVGSTGTGSKATARQGAATSGSGGLLGKLFPPRPAPGASGEGGRPSRAQPSRSVPVEASDVSGIRGALLTRMAQPGGRAALLALFVALVSAVTLLGFPVVPVFAFEYYGETVVEASVRGESERTELVAAFDDADPVTAGTGRLLDVADPIFAVVFSLVPIVISGIAVAALTKTTRSRTLLVSALAAALFVFFSQGIGTFFILGVFALGFAAYQSRKADAATAAPSSEG